MYIYIHIHTHTHTHTASTSTSKHTYNIIIYIYMIYTDTYTSTYTYTYTCVLKEGSIISESHLKRWIKMVSCKHSDQFQFQSTAIHSSGLQWSSLGRLRQRWLKIIVRGWQIPELNGSLQVIAGTIPYRTVLLHYITLPYMTIIYKLGELSSHPYIFFSCTSSATMLLWNW